MGELKRYIKLAKGITIQPVDEQIEDKIMERISKVKDSDMLLLDEKFLEYVKRNNSRLYLFMENIRNNPLRFSILLSLILLFSFFCAYEFKKLSIISSKNIPKDPGR